MIIGADVGGTFTDLVAVANGVITTHKVPTSPVQSDAVAEGARHLSGGSTVRAVVHGTTVATNALLERRGARTALLTDAGFEDVIEIGRQDRPSLYDPFADRAIALVARRDRLGVTDPNDVPELEGIEAVAIAMIDAHRDAHVEQLLRQRVAMSHSAIPISISSEVAPEFREFERISTTVLNAYLTPVTAKYLSQLEDELSAGRLVSSVSVMRSSGGLMSISDAAAFPAAVLLSGPAGGVIAARAVATQLGHNVVISFDMGGTSTDVCFVEHGIIDVSYERSIDGYACRLPSVGIETVGAGGGSIAWIDPGGSLRVGPQSAGADPGPACYGRGGRAPTVTDANVVLGRIDPAATLGGSVDVNYQLAVEAVGRLGDELGLSTTATALGVCRIAEDVMAGAVRSVSVDRGADPARAMLLAYGGAGGLHATAVARSLGMAGVIIPAHAGVFSALGLLAAPPRADAVAAVHIVGVGDLRAVQHTASMLGAATTAEIVAAGHEPTRTDWWLDVRYVGQSHEIAVPWDGGLGPEFLVERFEDLHQRRNGFVRNGDSIEIVAVRSSTYGPAPVALESLADASETPDAVAGRRIVVSALVGPAEATIVPRTTLGIGTTVVGPAVIEDVDATTFIDFGERATVASNGALEVTW